MFERLIAYHILELLKKSLEEIIQRSERIRFADDFLSSNEGVILLDSICMKLSAVGESVKNLDKITKRESGMLSYIITSRWMRKKFFVSVKRMFHLFWIRLIGCFSIFISKL